MTEFLFKGFPAWVEFDDPIVLALFKKLTKIRRTVEIGGYIVRRMANVSCEWDGLGWIATATWESGELWQKTNPKLTAEDALLDLICSSV